MRSGHDPNPLRPNRRAAPIVYATFALLLVAAIVSIAVCGEEDSPTREPATETETESPGGGLTLDSPAFDGGDTAPLRYTCDGDDVSPPLSWGGAADGVRSYALVLEDPDAPRGTFIHWVVYGIPADRHVLPGGLSREAEFARAGRNDFEANGYRGPCPPSGDGAHEYRFTLYALDTEITLPRGASKSELFDAMDGHVVDQTTLAFSYARQ